MNVKIIEFKVVVGHTEKLVLLRCRWKNLKCGILEVFISHSKDTSEREKEM